MKPSITKKIGIIGAGRLGTTLAAAICKRKIPGINLAAVSSKNKDSLETAEKIIKPVKKSIVFTTDNNKCVSEADCVFICTPDDAIEEVCKKITEAGPENLIGKLLIHFSGAKTLKVLLAAENAGAHTASIHPIKSFASIIDSIDSLPGTIYGVTYPRKNGGKNREFIDYFIESMEGTIIVVDDEKKSLYHAAACVASNYLVTLVKYATDIHGSIGIDTEDSIKALTGLIEGTVINIKKLGPAKSLTGPIARGDTGTVAEHLDNFSKYFEPGQDVIYRIMGFATAKIAFENGWINKSKLEEFKEIF